MGYFDDAKASREEENTLEHSSGPWKKHKYIQKIGEGANAVYKYAKNADKTITGSAYKKEAKDEKERAEYANELAGKGTKDYNYGANVDNVKNGAAERKFKTGQQWADSAAYHGRKAAEAESGQLLLGWRDLCSPGYRQEYATYLRN